ncbi:MAG: Flp pilus assembly protein CpaB [Desulfobulbus sp.]|jgi:Flp pilus assembly protein CpaB
MKKFRGFIALFSALFLAGLASYAVYNRMQEPAPPKKTASATAETTVEKPPEPPPRLSQRLEDGFRAVTLSLDAATGLDALRPGDRVDVIAVTPAGEDIKEGRLSRLLLSAIEVLEVADTAGNRSSRKQPVTLKVTPEQALELAAAEQASSLRLVLRRPEDRETARREPAAFLTEGGVSAYRPRQLDLREMIAPGMRAITVEVESTDGVGGIFQPGDRVDVVVTCPWGNLALGGENAPGAKGTVKETHRNAKIYFQNLKILTTSQSLHWHAPFNRPVKQVTLEVTPSQAEQLTVLVDSKGEKNVLRLLARNQGDDHLSQTEGAELLDLLGGRIPYSTVRIYRGPMVKDQVFYRAL